MNNQEEMKENEVTQETPEPQAEPKPETSCSEQQASAMEEAGQSAASEKKEEKKKGFFTKKSEVEELKTRISELEGENQKLKNEYMKAYADTENTRRRLQQEFEQSKKYRIQSFALDILPVLDNLERALAQPATPETESYRKGIEMIYQQLVHALTKEGVAEIEAEGKEFDPNFHNAVMHVEDEAYGENEVVEELQKGYMYRDTVVRHSMVKVAN